MTELHRCSAGRECRNAQHVEDLENGKTIRQGCEIAEPTGLCDSCTYAVSRAVDDMTETWLALHMAIGDQTRRNGQRVSITRSAPINLNADVDALKVAIVEWLTAAAARIAETLNCDDPQPVNNTDLEHARVVIACTRLLSPHIDRLLALPADFINVWLPHGETERPGEYWKDHNGVYQGRREVLMTGVDLALKLAELRRKSRKLLALTSPLDTLSLPCPGCGEHQLSRRHERRGSKEIDQIDCANCDLSWPYERYRQLCLIWVKEDEMERDKLQKQLDVQTRELELCRWLLAKREWQFALALQCTDIPASLWAQTVLVPVEPDNLDDLMTDKDIANLIGVADSTIRAWASRGHIGRHTADDGSTMFMAREVWEYAVHNSGRRPATERRLENQRNATTAAT